MFFIAKEFGILVIPHPPVGCLLLFLLHPRASSYKQRQQHSTSEGSCFPFIPLCERWHFFLLNFHFFYSPKAILKHLVAISALPIQSRPCEQRLQRCWETTQWEVTLRILRLRAFRPSMMDDLAGRSRPNRQLLKIMILPSLHQHHIGVKQTQRLQLGSLLRRMEPSFETYPQKFAQES
jgi:hypothetical protein